MWIFDQIADRDVPLRGVNNACEINSGGSSSSGFAQEIVVVRQKNAAKFACPVQQVGIEGLASPILSHGKHVDAPAYQPTDDVPVEIHVGVKPHASRFSRNRFAKGLSPAALLQASERS